MTNFCADYLKRNVDRGLERLFSNGCQREGLVSRADRMFLHSFFIPNRKIFLWSQSSANFYQLNSLTV